MILLADTFLANSSEPWRIPDTADLPEIDPDFAEGPNAGDEFLPYLRDERGARPWAIPGTPGLQHRIGGLEKENGSGNISYDPANHALMTELRAAEAGEAGRGAARARGRRRRGRRAARARLGLDLRRRPGRRPAGARNATSRSRPPTCATSTRCRATPARSSARFPKVLIPELNTGQLLGIIRGKFLVDAIGYNKIEGLPIFAEELERAILEVLS